MFWPLKRPIFILTTLLIWTRPDPLSTSQISHLVGLLLRSADRNQCQFYWQTWFQSSFVVENVIFRPKNRGEHKLVLCFFTAVNKYASSVDWAVWKGLTWGHRRTQAPLSSRTSPAALSRCHCSVRLLAACHNTFSSSPELCCCWSVCVCLRPQEGGDLRKSRSIDPSRFFSCQFWCSSAASVPFTLRTFFAKTFRKRVLTMTSSL